MIDKQTILKEQFDKMVYKMKLIEEYGNIFIPFYEKENSNQSLKVTQEKFLNEGLVSTYPSYKFVEMISRKFNQPKDYIDSICINKKTGIAEKIILYMFPVDYLDELKKCADSFGYFISLKQLSKSDRFQDIYLEPKFKKVVYSIDDIKNRYNIKYLYHIMPNLFLDKIQEQGLCPLTKNKIFEYPNRVYFFFSYNMEGFISFVKQLNIEEKEFVVLGIDIDKLKEHETKFKVDYYFEPDFNYNGYAIYTLQNIPPETVNIIDYITI